MGEPQGSDQHDCARVFSEASVQALDSAFELVLVWSDSTTEILTRVR